MSYIFGIFLDPNIVMIKLVYFNFKSSHPVRDMCKVPNIPELLLGVSDCLLSYPRGKKHPVPFTKGSSPDNIVK